MAIGLCGEFANMKRSWPGWSNSGLSTGYHGDDGYLRETMDETSSPVRFCDEKYPTGGVTVGCGIDWEAGAYYFTHEGELVGKLLKDPQHSFIYNLMR